MMLIHTCALPIPTWITICCTGPSRLALTNTQQFVVKQIKTLAWHSKCTKICWIAVKHQRQSAFWWALINELLCVCEDHSCWVYCVPFTMKILKRNLVIDRIHHFRRYQILLWWPLKKPKWCVWLAVPSQRTHSFWQWWGCHCDWNDATRQSFLC